MAVEKAQRYGKQFTDLIQDFCQGEKLSTDKMPDDAVISARVSIVIKPVPVIGFV